MANRVMINKKEAINDLKTLNGYPPHNDGSNYCAGDGYFANSLVAKYKMSLKELERKVSFSKYHKAYKSMINNFPE